MTLAEISQVSEFFQNAPGDTYVPASLLQLLKEQLELSLLAQQQVVMCTQRIS